MLLISPPPTVSQAWPARVYSSRPCTKTVLMDSGVLWEGVCWISVDLSLDFCIHAMSMFFEKRRKDNSCMQCRIPLQLNCEMAPGVSWV